MKLILPVAGKGERMRPYTNNLPKCLLPVGGKTIIDWIVADTLPLKPSETIFITGYKSEVFEQYINHRSEWGNVRTVFQNDPQGLGQAISLVFPYVDDNDSLLIILGDTLFDADISNIENADDNVLYTFKVEDPRRFGVAVTDAEGRIVRLVEKPLEFISDEALVGIYYIRDVKDLKASLKYLMDHDFRTRGEFQLTDALQMMIENGCKFRTAPVREWLDCGLPETLLRTNAWLLQNRREMNNVGLFAEHEYSRNVKLIPPCHIGLNVTLENCIIGPNVTVGNNCLIKNATLKDCIVWDNETVSKTTVKGLIVANGLGC